jgi:death on curing protein
MMDLSLQEVEYVAHQLAQETLDWQEPIPDFSTRFPGILESCLRTPFQKFGGRTLYPSLVEKAAVLFYLMIKNHPFRNGNKRVAMTTLFYFLFKNKKWLKVDNQELYNFARWVAESNPRLKDETIAAVRKFIKTYLVKL